MITGLTLLLVAAKLFGFAHYSWLVAFLPAIVGLVYTLFVLCLSVFLGMKSR